MLWSLVVKKKTWHLPFSDEMNPQDLVHWLTRRKAVVVLKACLVLWAVKRSDSDKSTRRQRQENVNISQSLSIPLLFKCGLMADPADCSGSWVYGGNWSLAVVHKQRLFSVTPTVRDLLFQAVVEFKHLSNCLVNSLSQPILQTTTSWKCWTFVLDVHHCVC